VLLAQDFIQAAPGSQAMDADGQVAGGGHAELRAEQLLLQGHVRIFHPAIETNLADGGRNGVKMPL
jgi:hypothetical protein